MGGSETIDISGDDVRGEIFSPKRSVTMRTVVQAECFDQQTGRAVYV